MSFFQIIPYDSVAFETILCLGHPLHTNSDASRTYSYRLSQTKSHRLTSAEVTLRIYG